MICLLNFNPELDKEIFAIFTNLRLLLVRCWRVRGCTYYGPHSNLLRVGDRVALSEDIRAAGEHSVAKLTVALFRKSQLGTRIRAIRCSEPRSVYIPRFDRMRTSFLARAVADLVSR